MKSEVVKLTRRLLRQKVSSPVTVQLPDWPKVNYVDGKKVVRMIPGLKVGLTPDMKEQTRKQQAGLRRVAAREAKALVNTLSDSVRARILKGRAGPPYDKVTKADASRKNFHFDPQTFLNTAAGPVHSTSSASEKKKRAAKKEKS